MTPPSTNSSMRFPLSSGLSARARDAPYSERLSRDKPQKTITPIAAMTNNISNVTGAIAFRLCISFTSQDLSETGALVIPSCHDDTVHAQHEWTINGT